MRRAAAWTAIVASAPRVGYVPNAADVRPSDEVEKHDRKRDLEASRTHLLDRNATGPFGESRRLRSERSDGRRTVWSDYLTLRRYLPSEGARRQDDWDRTGVGDSSGDAGKRQAGIAVVYVEHRHEPRRFDRQPLAPALQSGL